ncbi:MAG: SDR family oxidoreductase [Acidimicrobiia bacterium]|nr:SDR family oxidoreductase [Acidimicrobiia bacterium]
MTTTAPHANVVRGQSLQDKVALVTGGDGQLGRRVVGALGDLGASVALQHRGHDSAAVDSTLGRLRELGRPVIETERTLSSSQSVAELFDHVIDQFGRLDVVVHTPGQVLKKPLTEITDDEFETNLDANLRLAFYVFREAGRRLADGGRLVTMSTSITGVTIPGYSIYAGHKAATEHYVRALAKELGPRGVTVNAVAPGPINSPFYFGVENEASFQLASRLSGAGRIGEWDEVVPLIAFLCSPGAQWITAQTIRVNGGMTA